MTKQNIRKPQQPIKPIKPTKPEEKCTVTRKVDVGNNSNMDYILSLVPRNIGLDKVVLNVDCYDEYPEVYLEWQEQEENLHYSKEMVAYERKLSKFREDMRIWEEKQTKYKQEFAAWEIQDRQKQIDSLERRLKKLKKDVVEKV